MITFKEFINEKSAGLWANIHKRRKSGKRMRKPGEKGAPTAQDFKNASKEGFTHMNVKSKARPGFKIDGPKGVHKLSPSVKREIDKILKGQEDRKKAYNYYTRMGKLPPKGTLQSHLSNPVYRSFPAGELATAIPIKINIGIESKTNEFSPA